MRKKWGYVWILMLALFVWESWASAASMERRGGRVWIVDRTGEKWEVTEAEKLGFVPGGFQYGIGKDAIVPLGEDAFSETRERRSGVNRVIGFAAGEASKAVSVETLVRHEILNTEIGGTPVAAAY